MRKKQTKKLPCLRLFVCSVWNNGNYYDGPGPENGLSVARMMGHITYMSETSMEEKLARKLKGKDYSFSFATDFEVEGYLNYNGNHFVKRFDATVISTSPVRSIISMYPATSSSRSARRSARGSW
ncbi:MAG: hypothetical protein NT166_21595 [Candidatus Aminicenantes bacterium]|nr:hypothetical protein [Candidatus Aminicenantes bacterium]